MMRGHLAVFYVQNLTHDSATFSINHPLAGQCIGFRATVTAIRGATVEEINQGYPTLHPWYILFLLLEQILLSVALN